MIRSELVHRRWSGLALLVLVAGATVGAFVVLDWRQGIEVDQYVARLDYLAAHPDAQEQQLATIPMDREFTRLQLETYILNSIGVTFDLSELTTVRIKPGAPDDDYRTFVFHGDIFWRRVQ